MLMRDGYHNYLNDRETEWPNPYTQNRPRLPRLSPDHGYMHMAQGMSQGTRDGKFQATTHQTVRPDFRKAKRSVTQPDYYNQTAQWLTSVDKDTDHRDNAPTTERASKPPQRHPYRQVEDPVSMARPKQRRSQSPKQKRFTSQKYASHIDQYPLQEYTAGRVTRPGGGTRDYVNTVPDWESNPRGAPEAWGTSIDRERDLLHRGLSSTARDRRTRKAYDKKSNPTAARNEDVPTDFQSQRAAYFDSPTGRPLERSSKATQDREQMHHTPRSRQSLEDAVVTPEMREYHQGLRQRNPGHKTARQTLDFHDNAAPGKLFGQTLAEASDGNSHISYRSHGPEPRPSGSNDIEEMQPSASATPERVLPQPGSGFVRGMARFFEETDALGQMRHPPQAEGRDAVTTNSPDPLATGSQRRRRERTPKPQSNSDLWQPEEHFMGYNS